MGDWKIRVGPCEKREIESEVEKRGLAVLGGEKGEKRDRKSDTTVGYEMIRFVRNKLAMTRYISSR